MATATLKSNSTPERCVYCEAALESPIGCRECHSIFPSSSGIDHFMRLGLPRSFFLDPIELEKRFLAWSRELHPDFFGGRPEAERQLSLDLSSKLNDAYATLKDPARRAEYLLHLLDGPAAHSQRQMPQEFLERVLELRLEIEEAKQSGGAAPSALRDQLLAEKRQALDRVGAAFGRTNDRIETQMLGEIRAQLNSIKYLDGLLRDLDD